MATPKEHYDNHLGN